MTCALVKWNFDVVGEKGLPRRHDLFGNLRQFTMNVKKASRNAVSWCALLTVGCFRKVFDCIDQAVEVVLAVSDRHKCDDVVQVGKLDLHVEPRAKYLAGLVARVPEVLHRDDE